MSLYMVCLLHSHHILSRSNQMQIVLPHFQLYYFRKMGCAGEGAAEKLNQTGLDLCIIVPMRQVRQ